MKSKTTKLVLLLALLWLFFWVSSNFRDILNLHALQLYLAHYGPLAPLIFIALSIIATLLLIPGTCLVIAGGLLFGPVWGTFYNVIAAVIGSTFSFLIARYFARTWAECKARGKIKGLMHTIERESWQFVAITRLIPITPYNILNYTLGLTRMSVTTFSIASAIFMLPGVIIFSYMGSLGETFIYGSTHAIITKTIIIIGVLSVLSATPWIMKQFQPNPNTEYK